MHDAETSPDADGTTAVEKAAARPNELAALNQGVWIRTFRPAGSVPDPDAFRWHSPAIDEMLAMPAERQPNFTALLTSQQPLVAINAAIVLARVGGEVAQEKLVDAVPRPISQTPLAPRGGGSLGGAEKPSALEPLRELTDQYGNFLESCRRLHPRVARRTARTAWLGKKTLPTIRGSSLRLPVRRLTCAWRPWSAGPWAVKVACRWKSLTCAAIPRTACARRPWRRWLPAAIRRLWNTPGAACSTRRST